MHRLRQFALVAFLIAVPLPSHGADVLSEVPDDALGFVYLRNLSAVDAKAGQLTTLLQRNIPRPLAFLKDFAGISDGLDASGDVLIAICPATNSNDPTLVYCVWLPVSDYDRFLQSLGAISIEGVAAATIAGEDLLVARRGDWAVIMDPDQRERITQIVAADPSPPKLAAWGKWLDENDLTVVAFQSGVRSLVASTAANDAAASLSKANNTTPPNVARRAYYPNRRFLTFSDILEAGKTEFNKWLEAMPELGQAINANAVGCGLRVDSSGNALASFRVSLDKLAWASLSATDDAGPRELPPSLYQGGAFVWTGAGHVPPDVLAAYTRGYVRYLAADLKHEERTELDEAALVRAMEAGEKAAGLVQTFHFVNQPGEVAQPVYSNNFVAVRVTSTSQFVEHAKEVMRLWNSANRNAKGETRLVFNVEEAKVGDVLVTQYSLDMVELSGGAVLPEIRQQMEKLFGPEGKLRIWIAPVDDSTVVLAVATPEQIASTLKTMGEKHDIAWNRDGLRECNALLPTASDWRVFFDAHRFLDWQRREQTDMVGVPIIGGTLVRDFPPAPAIGVAGELRDGELRIDAAALAPTVKSADMYLARNRSRAAIQLRARAIAPVPVPAPAPAPQK